MRNKGTHVKKIPRSDSIKRFNFFEKFSKTKVIFESSKKIHKKWIHLKIYFLFLEVFMYFHGCEKPITFISSYIRNRAYAHFKISLGLMLHHIVLFGIKKGLKFQIKKMGKNKSFCHHSFSSKINLL